jgi:hypothetical protein
LNPGSSENEEGMLKREAILIKERDERMLLKWILKEV